MPAATGRSSGRNQSIREYTEIHLSTPKYGRNLNPAMQFLGRPASADRSYGSQRVDLSLTKVDPSNTTSGLGVKRFFWNQMTRAKRAGTWFRLCRRERAMYGLALRLDVKFQSHDLLKALVSVLKNLRDSCDRGYVALMKGTRLAWNFSEAAVTWGNERAREWRNDRTYIKFLAVMLK